MYTDNNALIQKRSYAILLAAVVAMATAMATATATAHLPSDYGETWTSDIGPSK